MLGAIVGDFATRIAEITEKSEMVEALMREIGEEIDRVWDLRKLDLVPGEELLGSVFGKFGLRYVKERDGVGLVSAMEENEIDNELREVIKEIAQ